MILLTHIHLIKNQFIFSFTYILFMLVTFPDKGVMLKPKTFE